MVVPRRERRPSQGGRDRDAPLMAARSGPRPLSGPGPLIGAARHSAGLTTAVFLCSAASAGASLVLPAAVG
ncbi:hypothetical protein GT002_37940, partial [Streptomyces sp. SID4917]|nr:hypothetical protein [Streptomyces sp. SID4917]